MGQQYYKKLCIGLPKIGKTLVLVSDTVLEVCFLDTIKMSSIYFFIYSFVYFSFLFLMTCLRCWPWHECVKLICC